MQHNLSCISHITSSIYKIPSCLHRLCLQWTCRFIGRLCVYQLAPWSLHTYVPLQYLYVLYQKTVLLYISVRHKNTWTLVTESHVQLISVSLTHWFQRKASPVNSALSVKLPIDPQPASIWTYCPVYQSTTGFWFLVFSPEGACAHLYSNKYMAIVWCIKERAVWMKTNEISVLCLF